CAQVHRPCAFCWFRTLLVHRSRFPDALKTRLKLDAGDAMAGEEDAVASIGREGADGDTLAAECLRDHPETSLEADVALGGWDGAHDLAFVVFNFGQACGHGAGAGTIAARRDV